MLVSGRAGGRVCSVSSANQLSQSISNLHLVLNVVCFLLGNPLASEFYMPSFRNTLCSIFIGA